MNMNLINPSFKIFFKISIISIILFMLVDLFFGRNLLQKFTNIEERYRVPNSIFHHSLIPNFDGVANWGGGEYRICTNSLGFKDNCNKLLQIDNNADIVFIGDSFTEGIGLQYEDTFVGQIALAKPELRIINMGVASYSPSVYLAKIRKFVDEGLVLKELVVYIDISDIHDEAIFYTYEDGTVRDKNISKYSYKLKIFVKSNLPLTSFLLTKLKNSALIISTSNENSASNAINYPSRGEWTYNIQSEGYGVDGVNKSINKSLEIMDELYLYLNERGIKLSIGVYPWPNQILYDVRDSRQVVIWKNFCEMRCKNFYNSFDSFFDIKNNIPHEKLMGHFFIPGDVHHSKFGAAILAHDFLK